MTGFDLALQGVVRCLSNILASSQMNNTLFSDVRRARDPQSAGIRPGRQIEQPPRCILACASYCIENGGNCVSSAKRKSVIFLSARGPCAVDL